MFAVGADQASVPIVWLHALAASTILFAASMATYSVLRHQNLWSDVYDLGQEVQVHWNTAQGRLFESSVEVQNNLGDHVTLVNMITAAVYRLFPAPQTLLILQPIIYALGAIWAFRIGLFFLGSPALAWLTAIAYLGQPAAAYAIGYDFHPMVYAAPFALACFDAAIRGRVLVTWLLFGLLLACREDAGMTAAAIGVFVATSTPRRKTGLAMTALGLAWFVVAMFFILPAVRGGPSDAIEKYACFGDTSTQILRNILTRPDMVADRLLEDTRRISFIPSLSLPWLGASMLTVSGWIGMVLTCGLGILSESPTKFTIGMSQPLVAMPVVTIAGVLGVRRLMRWFGAGGSHRGAITIAILWLVALGVLNCDNVVVRNRWQMSHNPLRQQLDVLRPFIPPDAPLSVTSKLGPHFCNRRQVAIYPITEWSRSEFPKLDQRRATHVLIQLTQARLRPEDHVPDPEHYTLIAKTHALRLYELKHQVAAGVEREDWGDGVLD